MCALSMFVDALRVVHELRFISFFQVTSMAHSRVEVDSFAGKETLNKDYGESFNGYLDTYGKYI